MRVQQLLCHCPPHLLFSHSQLRWLRWRLLTTVQGRDIYVSLPLFVLNLQSVMSTYIPPHNKLLKNDEFTSAVYGDSFITLLKESPRQKRAAGTPLNTCSTPFLWTECWPKLMCTNPSIHPSIPFANLLSSYHHTIMTVVYICLCVLYLLLDKWTNLDETLHKHCRGHHECQHLYFIQITQSYLYFITLNGMSD